MLSQHGIYSEKSRFLSMHVNEKDKFIQVIVGKVKADALKEFLNTDKGQNMFDVVCANKVRRNMSSILHRAGAKAKDAFQDLYDLLFNDSGVGGGCQVISLFHGWGVAENLLCISTYLSL